MAALIAARLKGRNATRKDVESLEDNKLSVLPDEKNREFDVELSILMLNG